MTDGQPEKRDDEELTEEEAVERLRKLLGEEGPSLPEEIAETDADTELEGFDRPELSPSQPPEVGDFESRFEEIEEIAARGRGSLDPGNPKSGRLRDSSSGPKGPDKTMRSLAIGFTLAYGFVGPIFAGYVIGLLLDQNSGGKTFWQTWLTLAGLISGFIFLIILLSRVSSDRSSKS